eukprot:m.47128 g.47128  ORF g.47128 m.47128 type:complete len:433 (+) comp20423_c0_seq1:111-1409(+)
MKMPSGKWMLQLGVGVLLFAGGRLFERRQQQRPQQLGALHAYVPEWDKRDSSPSSTGSPTSTDRETQPVSLGALSESSHFRSSVVKNSSGPTPTISGAMHTTWTQQTFALIEGNAPLDSWLRLRRDMAAASGRKATFMQIGANDGSHNDPLLAVLTENKNAWLGIQFEPTAALFPKLKRLHNGSDTTGWAFVQAAVSAACDEDGTITFYRYDSNKAKSNGVVEPTDGSKQQGQLNSLSDFGKDPLTTTAEAVPCTAQPLAEVIVAYGSAAFRKTSSEQAYSGASCVSWGCSCQGLSDAQQIGNGKWGRASTLHKAWWHGNACVTQPLEVKVKQHVSSPQLSERHRIDVLQIDVEGQDYMVLSTLLGDNHFQHARPAIIHYESKNLKKHDEAAAKQLLQSHGYFVRKTSRAAGDTLAVDLLSSTEDAWVWWLG